MPTPADSLSSNSTEEEIKDAISKTISQLIREGKERKQAVAIAFSMARKATGKQIQEYND